MTPLREFLESVKCQKHSIKYSVKDGAITWKVVCTDRSVVEKTFIVCKKS